jgi:hypothetical protein
MSLPRSRRLPLAPVVLALLVVLATVAPSPARAEEHDAPSLAWLSGDEIRRELTGRLLAGIYPSGQPWSEQIADDGTTDYREGAKHWQGQWWIAGREFCFSYPPPGTGGCFRVVRASANCFELYDFSGAAGQREDPPWLDTLWNGRMWQSDRPTTCEDRPSV